MNAARRSTAGLRRRMIGRMTEDRPDLEIRRRGGFKAVGAHVPKLTGALAARRGTTIARLAAEWSLIVGPEVARHCAPEKLTGAARPPSAGGAKTDARLTRPARPERGATLRLRVAGSMALELQYMAPRLIERINTHLGYAAVESLRITQGPLPMARASAPPAPPPPLDPARSASLRAGVAPIGDDRLRAALERLGRAVLARR
ncbi:MAG: DUF721 domain-containing protein [Rhodospirillales bacterium]|nr:MAG: DUF721 domain-containing protein [Rhodospirillales bacterium]